LAETLSSVAALLWPLLVLAALLLFRRPLLRVVRSAEQREWTLEVGGQKLTMKQLSDQQNVLIADLQKQVGALSQRLAEQTGPQPAPSTEAQAEERAPNSVLWVDDFPENNAIVLDQLQRSGVRVDLAKSTREALGFLGQRHYGAVLSDMGRYEDGAQVSDAGLRLLRAVRDKDSTTPFVIYCSTRAKLSYRDEALAAGATEITDSPVVVSERLQSFGLL
jgi:CheY-like chemotaxis protein